MFKARAGFVGCRDFSLNLLCNALLKSRSHACRVLVGLLLPVVVAPNTVVAQSEAAVVDNNHAPRVLSVPTLVRVDDNVEYVDLMITIASDGSVLQVLLDPSTTPTATSAEALLRIRDARFEPALREGVAIAARVRFRYRTRVAPIVLAPPGDAYLNVDESSDDELAFELEPATLAEEIEVVEPRDERNAPSADSSLSYEADATATRIEGGAATRLDFVGPELTTVPGTFGEPLRVVATLPGVVRSPFGIGFFLVRGAGFQNTGFYVDGFAVPILYHFGAGPAVLSSRLVSRLRFYPGGYPVAFGRFSAGVVALDTAPPPVTRSHFEFEVDFLRASVLGVVPFDEGRGSIAIALRRSYYELLLPLVIHGLSLSYTDYQLRADYRFSSRMRGSIFLFGSDDLLDQSGAIGGSAASSDANSRIHIEFQRAILRVEFDLPQRAQLRVAGSIGRDVQSFRAAQRGAQQVLDPESFLIGVRADLNLPLETWLRATMGIDALGSVFSITGRVPTPTGLGEYPRPIFDPQFVSIAARTARSTPGAYADFTATWAPLEVTVGVRAEWLAYGTRNDVVPDPRAVARLTLIDNVLIAKAASGLFTQPPFTLQTLSIGGNPGLPPQRAWQSSAGLELTLPEHVEAQVTGFYSSMWDIARFSQSVVSGPDGLPRREFFRADLEGRAYGLEVLLRRQVDQGFYGWLSYTLSRSERRSTDGGWVPFNYDQTHVLNLAASYAIDGWRFGLRFQLATGRPTSRVLYATFDADDASYDGTFESQPSDRLPTYHQLDARIDRDFDLGGGVKGSVYLDVLNAYYARNAEGVIYQYDYAASTPLPGLPILGTLGLRLEWEP